MSNKLEKYGKINHNQSKIVTQSKESLRELDIETDERMSKTYK